MTFESASMRFPQPTSSSTAKSASAGTRQLKYFAPTESRHPTLMADTGPGERGWIQSNERTPFHLSPTIKEKPCVKRFSAPPAISPRGTVADSTLKKHSSTSRSLTAARVSNSTRKFHGPTVKKPIRLTCGLLSFRFRSLFSRRTEREAGDQCDSKESRREVCGARRA